MYLGGLWDYSKSKIQAQLPGHLGPKTTLIKKQTQVEKAIEQNPNRRRQPALVPVREEFE